MEITIRIDGSGTVEVKVDAPDTAKIKRIAAEDRLSEGMDYTEYLKRNTNQTADVPEKETSKDDISDTPQENHGNDSSITGTRIKEERLALHAKQSIFAQKLGINPVLISNWETGVSHPSDKSLDKLVRLLNVDKAYLTGEQAERRKG